MSFSISEIHAERLSYLFDKPVEILQDFCRLAINYVNNGPNEKLYESAADKLSIGKDDIRNIIESLIFLLIECCKHQVNEETCKKNAAQIGFRGDQADVLFLFYDKKKALVSEILTENSSLPYFNDLKWRFEAKVASRSLLHQMIPKISLDLKLGDSGRAIAPEDGRVISLEMRPEILNGIADTLEKALQESQTRESRTLRRNLRQKLRTPHS